MCDFVLSFDRLFFYKIDIYLARVTRRILCFFVNNITIEKFRSWKESPLKSSDHGWKIDWKDGRAMVLWKYFVSYRCLILILNIEVIKWCSSLSFEGEGMIRMSLCQWLKEFDRYQIDEKSSFDSFQSFQNEFRFIDEKKIDLQHYKVRCLLNSLLR